MSCSWRLAAGCDAVIEASFYGTAGRATLRNRGGSFYDFIAERARGTALEILGDEPDAWGGRAALGWVDRLRHGGRFREREDLLEVAAVLDSIYAPVAGSRPPRRDGRDLAGGGYHHSYGTTVPNHRSNGGIHGGSKSHHRP